MNLRRAQAEDAPRLAKVHVDSWQAAYHGIVPDAYLKGFTYQKRETAFRRALESGEEETYLLEDNDQDVGILTIGQCRDADLDSASIGEIWGIYLSPEYRRHGIGRRLVKEAEDILHDCGCRELILWVLEDNMEARTFYEAMGFHQDGATKLTELGKPLKVVRYAKKLAHDYFEK
jgi:ribosomal protein S18 acetylase RimI-like enzyme